MKKILSILTIVLLAAVSAIAQSPSPGIFNYQGVARNSVGNVLINQTIRLRLTIHDGAAAGPTVYQESRTTVTNPFGLFNVQVGSAGATNVTGTIAGVLWGVNTKFIQVEIDPNGGTSFINIGTAQLASVPYSLYSSLSNDLVLPFIKTQSDPGSLFRVNNSGAGAALQGTSSGTGSAGLFNNTNAANNASTVYISTNGTSANALSLSGPGIWGSAMGITNKTSGMEWRTSVNGNTYTVTKVPGTTFSPFLLFDDGQVEFPSTAGATRLRILNDGTIGVNTATPSNTAKMQVNGTKITFRKKHYGFNVFGLVYCVFLENTVIC